MKALSVRAPWWWFILHGGKDIENREWPTKFRGTVYLHSSKWFSLQTVSDDSEDAAAIVRLDPSKYAGQEITFRQMRDAGGCIVGTIDIVDCVTASSSPWFFGRYGFVLANPVALAKPIPFKGALGFFDVPDSIVKGGTQ